MVLWILVAFIYGIAIGSFLNVVIWRLPRGGSVAEPTWSYCPQCKHRLGAWDLFPVFSFLALGAKCRYCRAPISWRYPAIELLTGLLFAAVAWRFGGTWDTVFYCLFLACLVCVFFVDLEHFIIPDELNVIAAMIGIVHNAVGIALRQPGQWVRLGGVALPASLVGLVGYAAVVYGIGLIAYVVLVGKRKGVGVAAWNYLRENAADWGYLTLYFLGAIFPPLRRHLEPPAPLEGFTAEEIEADEDAGGMGGGDGKLVAAIGANLYWPLWLQSWGLAIVLGAVTGMVVLARQRRKLGERVAIPFGPALVGGAVLALFFGPQIVAWYVGHFLSYPGSPFVPRATV